MGVKQKTPVCISLSNSHNNYKTLILMLTFYGGKGLPQKEVLTQMHLSKEAEPDLKAWSVQEHSSFCA